MNIPQNLKISAVQLAELLQRTNTLRKQTDWRVGQTFFNLLFDFFPQTAEHIRGTDLDPFYRDDRLATLYGALLSDSNEHPKLVKILTHDGAMHADEVMACVVLLGSIVNNTPVTITRKRLTGELLNDYDYVVDTGGQFDGEQFFDHHQSTFTRTHPNGIAMSAFGLVWERFGLLYIINLLQGRAEVVEEDYQKVYNQLLPTVQWFDAHDNGQLKSTTAKSTVEPTANLDAIQFTNVISFCNPQALFEQADENHMMERFNYAVDLGRRVLNALVWRKAGRLIAERVVDAADKGGPILVLPYYVEWNSPVSARPHIKFVVHPGMDTTNFVVNVAKNGSGYGTLDNLRQPFPARWAGLANEQLVAATGIASALFCHKGRHLATAASLNGAMELARAALSTKTT